MQIFRRILFYLPKHNWIFTKDSFLRPLMDPSSQKIWKNHRSTVLSKKPPQFSLNHWYYTQYQFMIPPWYSPGRFSPDDSVPTIQSETFQSWPNSVRDDSVQDFSVPDGSVQDFSVPNSSVQDVSVPNISVQDVSVPDTSVQNFSVPDTSVLNISVRDHSVPRYFSPKTFQS